eukprot:12663056-Alexandrium_andersonii.AAC.1
MATGLRPMFWTYERSFHHLTRSRCGARAQRLFGPLEREQVLDRLASERRMHAENVRQGLNHRRAHRGAVQLCGPK